MTGNTNIQHMFTITEIRRIAREQLRRKYRQAFIPCLIYTLFIVLPPVLMAFASYIVNEPDISIQYAPASPQGLTVDISGTIYVRIGYLIYSLLIVCAMKISIAQLSLSMIREERFSVLTMLAGFSHYWQSLGSYIVTSLYKMLWAVVTLAPAAFIFGLASSLNSFPLLAASFVFMFVSVFFYILMTIRYTLWNYIAADDRNIRPSITVAASVSMLKGSEISLMTMLLSFAGWVFLIALGAAASADMLLMGSSPVFWFIAGILFTACMIGVTMLLLYVYTSLAVFYSAVSGNFSMKGE